jgi:hypothetical protein
MYDYGREGVYLRPWEFYSFVFTSNIHPKEDNSDSFADSCRLVAKGKPESVKCWLWIALSYFHCPTKYSTGSRYKW